MDTSNYRVPKYLSPSGLACWEKSPEEYFLRYIAPEDVRPERPPQTDPMSVGSAFDALVKADIYKDFYGLSKANEEGYLIRDLVNVQCEEHTLPESLVIACELFEQYRETGALADIKAAIRRHTQYPRMEFTVVETIEGVPLLGKPDLHYGDIIADWKVSGSVSKRGVSPQQGYQIARDIHGSRTNGESHKRYEPKQHSTGEEVSGYTMDKTTDYWADQLSTYAWCLGHRVGSEGWVARIEQIACRPCPPKDESGVIRAKCCTHQTTVSQNHQLQLIERYKRCWWHVSNRHYFPDCDALTSDARANAIVHDLTPATELTLDTLPEINW